MPEMPHSDPGFSKIDEARPRVLARCLQMLAILEE